VCARREMFENFRVATKQPDNAVAISKLLECTEPDLAVKAELSQITFGGRGGGNRDPLSHSLVPQKPHNS
jgi:hypothetical protein